MPVEEPEKPAPIPDPTAPAEAVSPPPPAPPEPKRRELDPSVADILREEAEAEFEARKQRQSGTLESQPELGLDVAEDRPAQSAKPEAEDRATQEKRAQDAKRRMARMRGEPDHKAEVAAATAVSSRRELLPDIEEINSTLRNGATPSGADANAGEELSGAAKRQRSGFRRGFLVMLVLFAALLLIYVFAPQIAQAVPAADPVLSSYVAWVDQMRMALNTQLGALLAWLDETASQSGN